jgi:hypothetical protein
MSRRVAAAVERKLPKRKSSQPAMLDFAFSPLLWGLLIVGVPVLIHLINMLRHRRVDWAAMEFLLVSQKKNRTWIMFKQLLLLLLRMLAVAAVVLMVAQPLLHNKFGEWFGSTVTHHIVLLDDSFSMSDRWANTSAFDEARAVVKQIGAGAARQARPQTFTLLRFSQVAHPQRGTQPDIWEEQVKKTDFVSRLSEVLDEMRVSQTSAGPTAAMQAIGQLLGDPGDERWIVHLVSDFRAREWNDPTDLKKQLMELNKAEAEIRLVNCVDRTRKNLAVTSLAQADGVQAAGVQFFMEVTVKNFGPTLAKEVPVFLEEASQSLREGSRRRPVVTIAEIPPAATVKERFRVHLATAGKHLLTARLSPDGVEVDNSRYAVVDLPPDLPVLLVDGSLEARDARYVSLALAPGGPVRTGIRPQIETPRYLSLKPLGEFRAITLMDVAPLDQSAIEALEEYIRAGGGVAVFLGPRCSANSKFINESFHRQGEGFLPVPLLEAEPRTLSIIGMDRAPDMQVEAHPIFRILAGKRNSFISTVVVERYLAVADGWKPPPESSTRVIARLRDGAPLAVECRFGEGRVVAVLTTAAPDWNNWARNPSFPPAMVDLQAYLSQRSVTDVSRRVGSRLELELDQEEYDKQVHFTAPDDALTKPAPEAGASSAAGTGNIYEATPTKQGTLAVSFAQTDLSGIYEAKLTRNDGTDEIRSYALNVDAEEGNLKALSGAQLAERLNDVDYEYEQAGVFQYTLTELAGYDVSEWLLYLLIVMLIGEQILAWSCSYHPPSFRSAGAKGGVR